MCSIALAVVGTRNEIALIPCVDMINHSRMPRSTLAYDLVSDADMFVGTSSAAMKHGFVTVGRAVSAMTVFYCYTASWR